MPSLAEPLRFRVPLRRVSLRRTEIESGNQAAGIEAARAAAYQHGFDDATKWLNQQLAEQRDDVVRLQEQALRGLLEAQSRNEAQLATVLPGLAAEMVRRLFAGLEPDLERIENIVEEALSELSPGTPNIEVALSTADHVLMHSFDPQLADKYPGLRLLADPALISGDCVIRSGFGIIDARVETKLQNLTAALR